MKWFVIIPISSSLCFPPPDLSDSTSVEKLPLFPRTNFGKPLQSRCELAAFSKRWAYLHIFMIAPVSLNLRYILVCS